MRHFIQATLSNTVHEIFYNHHDTKNNLKIYTSNQPNVNWNEFIHTHHGDYGQTTEYADYIKTILNHKPIFVTVSDDKDVQIGQMLYFEAKKIFLTKKYLIDKPVIQDEYLDYIFHLLPLLKKKVYQTIVMDLTQGIEQILQNSDKKSVRNNIRRAISRGVTIRNITNDKESLSEYGRMFYQWRKKLGIETKNKEQILKEITNMDKYTYVFGAFWNNAMIGCISGTIFNDVIRERGIARTDIDKDNHLYSTDLLRFELMKFGKENKCKLYDFAGLPDYNENLRRSKTKWNGKIKEVYRYV